MENLWSEIECGSDVKQYEDILNYLHWRHRIPIGDHFLTPGYLSDDYWDLSHFPKSLAGKTVLDIGSNDGINSFHAERIGAIEVTGIDLYHDKEDQSHTTGWNQAGCQLAKKALNSKVEFKAMSAYDVKELGKTYDVVMMADVMNWLSDLPRLLAAVSSVCGETLIIRDGLISKNEQSPYLEYVHTENYDLMYLPNAKFMEVILKQNGFKEVTFQKINVDQLFDNWVMDFPLVTANEEIQVFESPWSSVVVKQFKPTREQAISKVGERLLLRGHGWIDMDKITGEIFKSRPMFAMARKIFGDGAVVKIKRLIYKQPDTSYTIIATR